MTETEILITALGTSVVLTAAWVLKNHLKNRSDEKKLTLESDARLNLSQEETKRLEIVTKAMVGNSVMREANINSEAVRGSFLRVS